MARSHPVSCVLHCPLCCVLFVITHDTAVLAPAVCCPDHCTLGHCEQLPDNSNSLRVRPHAPRSRRTAHTTLLTHGRGQSLTLTSRSPSLNSVQVGPGVVWRASQGLEAHARTRDVAQGCGQAGRVAQRRRQPRSGVAQGGGQSGRGRVHAGGHAGLGKRGRVRGGGLMRREGLGLGLGLGLGPGLRLGIGPGPGTGSQG